MEEKKEKKKLSLSLNKEVIDQLDRIQLNEIKGGALTTIIGSNCYNTNPAQYNCCDGSVTTTECCYTYVEGCVA